MTGVAYLILFRNIKNKETSMEPRVGLAFMDWLTQYTAFLVKQNIYKEHKSLDFSHSPAGRNSSILGLEIYFTILLPFLSFKRFDQKYWFSMTTSYYCLFRS